MNGNTSGRWSTSLPHPDQSFPAVAAAAELQRQGQPRPWPVFIPSKQNQTFDFCNRPRNKGVIQALSQIQALATARIPQYGSVMKSSLFSRLFQIHFKGKL
jgi:hypothetical protein